MPINKAIMQKTSSQVARGAILDGADDTKHGNIGQGRRLKQLGSNSDLAIYKL